MRSKIFFLKVQEPLFINICERFEYNSKNVVCNAYFVVDMLTEFQFTVFCHSKVTFRVDLLHFYNHLLTCHNII